MSDRSDDRADLASLSRYILSRNTGEIAPKGISMRKQMQFLMRYAWMAPLVFAGALAGCHQNGTASAAPKTIQPVTTRATFVVYTLPG